MLLLLLLAPSVVLKCAEAGLVTPSLLLLQVFLTELSSFPQVSGAGAQCPLPRPGQICSLSSKMRHFTPTIRLRSTDCLMASQHLQLRYQEGVTHMSGYYRNLGDYLRWRLFLGGSLGLWMEEQG